MYIQILKIFILGIIYLLFSSCAGDNPIIVNPVDKYLIKLIKADNKLFAIGTEGRIFLSNDGNNWNNIESKVNQTLLDMYYFDKDLSFIVGEKGLLLKSTDGGNNWIFTQIQSNQSFNSVFFLSKEIGWVAGNNGKLFISTNGGNSWQDTSFVEEGFLTEVYFENNGFGFVTGSKEANFSEPLLYITNDFGQNWEEIDLSFYELQGISSVKYFSNLIYLIAENKIITCDKTNKFSNFEIIADNSLLDSNFKFSSIYFEDIGLISETIISGFQGHNIGMIYNKELNVFTKTENHIFDITKFNSNEIYVGGYGYKIMKKSNNTIEYLNLE